MKKTDEYVRVLEGELKFNLYAVGQEEAVEALSFAIETIKSIQSAESEEIIKAEEGLTSIRKYVNMSGGFLCKLDNALKVFPKILSLKAKCKNVEGITNILYEQLKHLVDGRVFCIDLAKAISTYLIGEK